MDGIMSIRLAQEKFRANCIEYARILDTASAADTCDNTTPGNNKVRHSDTSGDGYYDLELDTDTDQLSSVSSSVWPHH